jgi:hypothetical protein
MTLTAATLALRKLVEANLGVVERGLGLVDRHFSLGASAVGVMALDATGSLTLIAVDLSADDDLFRGAAGAYRWCRRHPDVVQRLFPDARISPGQPPRLLFVVQRVARSFLRTMDRLGFAPVGGMTLLDLGIDDSATVALEVEDGSRRGAFTAPGASDYSQRMSTFTLGYSGGLPSTSTIRMLPS